MLLLLIFAFYPLTDQVSELFAPDLIEHLRIFLIVLCIVCAGLWLLRPPL